MLDDAVYSLSCDEEGQPVNDEQAFSLESVAVIHKGKSRIAAGKPSITEEIIADDGRTVRFEISPQSFFQVNPEQMIRFYDKAAEYAALKGARLFSTSTAERAPSVSGFLTSSGTETRRHSAILK